MKKYQTASLLTALLVVWGACSVSKPASAEAPYDLRYLDSMIEHHQGAIDMAQMAQSKAQHSELKVLAASMITTQQRELAQMKQWRGEWYAGKPQAASQRMSSVTKSVSGTVTSMPSTNMDHMQSASGNAFDLMFINMMIPHHQEAVTMANEASQRAEHKDLKSLSKNISSAQSAEIKTMRSWQSQWTL
jgi:uncharacterized protein (DUF305 family)